MQSYLVGGRVRALLTGEPLTKKADYDVVVVGSTYRELLSSLLSTPDVVILLPNSEYHSSIIKDTFTEDYLFDTQNANNTTYKMGVIKARVGTKMVDYALARRELDVDYVNNNLVPTHVINSSDVTLGEDLSRRDFTMNALCLPMGSLVDLDVQDKSLIIDKFEGANHIVDRRIHTIGKAYDRFLADPSRIIRLFKFSLRLGFTESYDIWCLFMVADYHKERAALANAYNRKINVDRSCQELKNIFNDKYSFMKVMGAMWFLGDDMKNVIFDGIYLNPTVISK